MKKNVSLVYVWLHALFLCPLNVQEDSLQGEVLASITVMSPFFAFYSSFNRWCKSWGCATTPTGRDMIHAVQSSHLNEEQ